MFDAKLDKLVSDLILQWNIAERRIKKAEQVEGNEVVSPAIFELRYAGRKIIDTLFLLLTKDWRNDQAAYEDICRFLADAIEDCVKAKHDAIDAMVDFVTIWFSEVEREIGANRLLELFSDYFDVTGSLAEVQEKIAQSRENRLEARDGVYDEIERDHLDGILRLYNKMRLSKTRVQEIADVQNRKESGLYWMTFISTAAAVGLIGFEIWKAVFGHG